MQFNNPNPDQDRRGFNEVVLTNRLGAPCHFNSISNPVPVYVITDLKGNIIVNNCYIPYPQTAALIAANSDANGKKLTEITAQMNAIIGDKVTLDKNEQIKIAALQKQYEDLTAADININNQRLTEIAAKLNAIIGNKVTLNKEDQIKVEALQKQQEALTAANNKITQSKQTYLKWFISGVKTTVTRFFSCSTATVMITCAIEDEGQFTPQLPNYLKAENDICIWAGFIESYRPVRQSDLTTKLLRIFTGIIDTNQFTGTGTGGYTVAISCRDRLKWLMDTSNTFDIQAIKGTTLDRSDLILQIAQIGIGFTKEAQSAAEEKKYKFRKITYTKGLTYNQDLAKEAKEYQKLGTTFDKGRVVGFEAIYLSNLTDYKKSPPLAGNVWCPLEVKEDPEFIIYTSRVGISTQNTAQLMIKQQHPVDMLKTLSMQEVYPTDVFQDHRDGNFYYYPHASDYNSLNDPKRYFRTYFFRVYPSLANKDLANLSYKTASEYKITDTVNLGFTYRDANLYFDGRSLYKVSQDLKLLETTASELNNAEFNSSLGTVVNNQLNPNQLELLVNRETGKVPYPLNRIDYLEIKDPIIEETNYVLSLTNGTNNAAYDNKEVVKNTIFIRDANNTLTDQILKVQLSKLDSKWTNTVVNWTLEDLITNKIVKSGYFLFETTLSSNVYTNQKKDDIVERNQVALLPPHVNQMIISLRHEQSSVGVFTNFILYKSNNQEQLVTTEWTMHLELMPEDFLDEAGNNYNVAKKFVRIEDPNIQTPAEGISVLLNAARIYARSLQVASIIINGDPSICPGEIFQVFGSPLLKNDGIPNLLQDRYNYLLMKNLSITNFKELAVRTSVTDNLSDNNANATTNKPIDPNKIGDGNAIPFTLHNNSKGTAYIRDSKTGEQALTSEQVLDKPTAVINRDAATTVPETKTVFRCEAVSHKINIGGSRGFTTEVALTIPYIFTLLLLGNPLLNTIQHLSSYCQ